MKFFFFPHFDLLAVVSGSPNSCNRNINISTLYQTSGLTVPHDTVETVRLPFSQKTVVLLCHQSTSALFLRSSNFPAGGRLIPDQCSSSPLFLSAALVVHYTKGCRGLFTQALYLSDIPVTSQHTVQAENPPPPKTNR